jgi:galactose mutarotase-like enzyme
MSEIVLTSGQSRTVILPERGALVSSLRFETEHDSLWLPENFSPTSSAWPGGGLPFLFPFAGRVWHHGELAKYGLGETIYSMPLHGFSWATAWTPKKIEVDEVTLELQSSETSLGLYPFHFKISMKLKLTSNSLRVNVTIKHERPHSKDSNKMPVAVGWHPYLSLSNISNSIDIAASVNYPVTLQGDAGKPINQTDYLGSGPWSLPKNEIQSLIFSELTHAPSVLKRHNQPNLLISSGPPEIMNHLVTWTNLPSKFHCIEPWMSLPNAIAAPTGCQWLEAGQSLDVWFKIENETQRGYKSGTL